MQNLNACCIMARVWENIWYIIIPLHSTVNYPISQSNTMMQIPTIIVSVLNQRKRETKHNFTSYLFNSYHKEEFRVSPMGKLIHFWLATKRLSLFITNVMVDDEWGNEIYHIIVGEAWNTVSMFHHRFNIVYYVF